MAKAKGEAKKVQVTKVPIRDVLMRKAGIEAFAQEIRLPLPVAMRSARMIAALAEAQDAYEKERRKVHRDVKAGRTTPEKAEEEYQKEGDKTIEVRGSLPYRVISEEVERRKSNGEPAPANLGNIIAAIMPFLTDMPEDDE